MKMVRSQPAHVRCPRCRYDQQGAMATWTESCPMQGRCTECGLEFDWAYVLHPDKFEPRWCVEFAPRIGLPRSCMATFLRSLWPRGFWRRHNMAHALRGRRLLIYGLFLLLATAMLYVVVQASVAVSVRRLVELQLIENRRMLPAHIASMQSQMTEAYQARLRDEYGWTDEDIEASQQYAISRIVRMQTALNGPVVVNQSYARAVYEAVFLPRSAFTSGSIQDPTGWFGNAYPAPIELYGAFIDLQTVRGVRFVGDRSVEFLATSVGFLGLGIAGVPLLPLSLALLPVSRRRARVRWPHVLRVFIYSLFLPVVFAYLTFSGVAATLVFAGAERFGPVTTFTVGALGPWVGLIVWWAAAIRHYLRMPHAFAVAFLLAVMTFLLLIAGLAGGAAAVGALYDLLS